MHKCIIYITLYQLCYIVILCNNPLYNHYKLQIHVFTCVYINRATTKKPKCPHKNIRAKTNEARDHTSHYATKEINHLLIVIDSFDFWIDA